MAASLRPRRGKRSTAISKNIVLKRGEIFFETPDTGVGTGEGGVVMGDGTTAYGDLPYFIKTGSGTGTVKSVNHVDPDESGNVNLNSVPYAENIISPDNESLRDGFIFRTSGGSKDVNPGDANLDSIEGNCVKVDNNIIVATPLSFKAVGLNQFDKSSMVISGYTIDNSGNVVAAAGKSVAFIHAVGGLDTGYLAYSKSGYIERIGWSAEIPTTTSRVIISVDDVNVTALLNGSRSAVISAVHNGYVCVAVSNTSDLVVHPKWSGTADTEEAEYSEVIINIPTADSTGAALPTASYGFPSVGDVRDEINFNNKTYTKRVGHYAYSAANLELVKALGVNYIYDNTHIFYVLDTPVVYTLNTDVSGAYTVNDFGTEEFTNTSAPVIATTVYGANLRDKLRRDVVTISKQTLSKNQQSQVQRNIDAFSNHPNFTEADDTDTETLLDTIIAGNPMNTIMGANKRLLRKLDANINSKVATVNATHPDANGNVELTRIPLADNLYSPDNNESYGAYLTRTAGGTSDISSGTAQISFIRGTMTVSGRITESISCGINSTYEPEPEEIYVLPTAFIDIDTWRKTALASASGTYKFVAEGENWKYNGSVVDLEAYGITVEGTIKDADEITVIYVKPDRGVIHTIKPSTFIATGLNVAFDYIDNATINSNGDIVAASGSYVAIAYAPYSDPNGYVAYDSNGSITNIGFVSQSGIPTIGSKADLSGRVLGTSIASYIVPESSKDTNIGFIVVSCTNKSKICIHPRWSGGKDTAYEAYARNSIAMPTKDIKGVNLPYVEYGMPEIHSVADEINFDLKQYIQRIGHMAYSEANLKTVEDMNVDYDYDNNHIFYVLENPVIFTLESSVNGIYTVNDFGIESIFWSNAIGGTGSFGNQFYVCHLYGQNLRDKLRRDVLTISSQSLTDAQKMQVLTNIGAASQQSVTQLNNDIVGNPLSRNGIYRGKHLGTISSGNVDAWFVEHAIASGGFNDIFIGDTVDIQDGIHNDRWIVAGINTYYLKGGYSYPGNSVCLLPQTYVHNAGGSGVHTLPVNSTNTTGVSKNSNNPLYATTGGNEKAGYQSYYGSDMNQIYLPQIVSNLQQVLGSHLCVQSQLLANTIGKSVEISGDDLKFNDTLQATPWGSSTNWAWCDTYATLLSEVEVYGSVVFGNAFDVGIGANKLPLFNFISHNHFSRTYFWLRSVASASNFCVAISGGGAHYYNASNAYYVRPLIIVR